MRHLLRLPVIIIFLLLLKACAMTPEPPQDHRLPYPLPHEPGVGDIFHLPSGYAVDHDTVIDHARRVQVVFVGETHDNVAARHLQQSILKALSTANPGAVTLAMEMFTPSQQPLLDRWVADDLTETEFIKETNWYSTWGIDFSLYRELLLFARDEKIKILALNAERPLREALSTSSIDKLPVDIQQQLPDMDFDDPHYRNMIAAFQAGHPMGNRHGQGFLRVQTLWDESMAETLAKYLSTQGQNHQVVVVAGNNHVQYGFGIPRRLFRRLPASYLLIGTTETAASTQSHPERFMEVEKPDHPLLPYHFLYILEYEEPQQSGVRLGVMIATDSEPGVLVQKVLPGSIAARNALQPDDRLLHLDQQPLEDTFDLIFALRQKQVGDTSTLVLLRDGKEMIFEIEFTAE